MSRLQKSALGAALALGFLLSLGIGSSGFSWVFSQRKASARASFRPAQGPRVDRDARLGRRRFASDRVLVRLRDSVPAGTEEAYLGSCQLRAIHRIPGVDVYRAQTPAGMTVAQTLAVLRANPDVAYANPDYRTRIAVVPNDPYFLPYQYNLDNRGSVLNLSSTLHLQTTAHADIKATAAWEETQGDPETVIAVLDTGVDMSHVELANKVVSGGHDFVNNDDDATDDSWHGTHVAGIAAAETGNGEGIAGVAWNCKILPVKVMDQDGNGYYSALIEGITWAADNGAKVINLSVGGDVDDPALEEACRYAYDKNVVVVAAVGNDTTTVLYPAAYDAYVLAVASTDYNDEWSSFSNSGPQVDVAAPGVYILGPVPQWFVGPGYEPYVFATGTSMATPHVSGMAALLLSAKPWLAAKDVMAIIRYTADDVNKADDPGRDDHIGYGRINMERALVPYVLK
jgi:thermitase